MVESGQLNEGDAIILKDPSGMNDPVHAEVIEIDWYELSVPADSPHVSGTTYDFLLKTEDNRYLARNTLSEFEIEEA